jgi:hypothetical protein
MLGRAQKQVNAGVLPRFWFATKAGQLNSLLIDPSKFPKIEDSGTKGAARRRIVGNHGSSGIIEYKR